MNDRLSLIGSPIVSVATDNQAKPAMRDLGHLRPRDRAGWTIIFLVIVVSTGGVALSLQEMWVSWLFGQAVLALAFLQWFAILHEAGHGTLFRTPSLNVVAGHLAGVFVLVPFHTWKLIHARHHRFTGWKDLDPTTAALVPRKLARVERALINGAWTSGLPLFSMLYRLQNFWHLPRFARFVRRSGDRKLALVNVALLISAYILLMIALGAETILGTYGLGLLLGMMAQDVILLSQHTHMPSNLSGGKPVRPFKPFDQERFTRTLRLPRWLSRFLLGFDLHELHHMYVAVPGFHLHRIPYRPANEVDWFTWIRGAKALSGTSLIFGRRDQTGFTL